MDMSTYVGNVFLKVEDIKASGPIEVTITDVSEGRYGKPDLTFDDGSRFSLNTTNSRALARAYGTDSDDWVDKKITLTLGKIPYNGVPQDAIVVSPTSPAPETKASAKPASKAPAQPDMDEDITF